VIYAGTMSKILCPSLRLGYIVAPEPLVDSFVKIRSAMDQHSSPIDQATLARFITEGFFLSHIKRMRKFTQSDEIFSSISSTNYSVIVSPCRFQKLD
jgi:Transcriptional regulators containing a DNA-binding HTH domain and an aminotransferase domain (MocR family) and their eukaryotic orthologs